MTVTEKVKQFYYKPTDNHCKETPIYFTKQFKTKHKSHYVI